MEARKDGSEIITNLKSISELNWVHRIRAGSGWVGLAGDKAGSTATNNDPLWFDASKA